MNALGWIVGLFAIAALVSSGVLAAVLGVPWLERLHPRTRGRILAWTSPVPMITGALVVAAIFLPHPWLGLPDHCLTGGHAHLHLCLSCGLPTPPVALAILAGSYLLWVGASVTRVLWQLTRAQRAIRRLTRVEIAKGPLSVLPSPGLVAFVAGFLRPRVFVSEAVTGARWSAVIAHEEDHARHRDPLARLLSRLALCAAAPGIGRWLERSLVRAQELAADEAAAEAVGDRVEVAQQVLAWASRPASPSPAFGDGDLDERVRLLVDPPRYLSGPSRRQVGTALTAALLGLVGLAPSIHHGVEELLHLLQHHH